MAPLLVVDPRQPGWEDRDAWGKIRQQLKDAKAMGARAISVDVWWGIVQRNGAHDFDWAYYDKLFREITDAGLQIVPVLSVHQCGGNVGDDVYIPLPPWFVEKLKPTASRPDLAYWSEAGNRSEEVASVWATPYVLDDYRRFWEGFRDHFANFSGEIRKIVIGMGPAGELLYPSYHLHDRSRGFYAANVPNRGSLQASSDLAQENFRGWLRRKYETIEALNAAWGSGLYSDFEQIRMLTTTQEVEAFLGAHNHYSQQGKDFFEWYHGSLMEHGYRLAVNAYDVFQKPGAVFHQSDLAFKVPGVHWHFHNRMAQLMAGLIETRNAQSDHDNIPLHQRWPADWIPDRGHGYEFLFQHTFERIKRKLPDSRWIGIFTCAEMGNYGDSGAWDLVRAIGRLAGDKRINFFVENALAENLYHEHHVRILASHLSEVEMFKGASLLRLRQALESEAIRNILAPERAAAEPKHACSHELLVLNNADSSTDETPAQ